MRPSARYNLKIGIYTSRPGIIIGRRGTEVDKLKQEIQKRTSRVVFINIRNQKPELGAQLISVGVNPARKARRLPPSVRKRRVNAPVRRAASRCACRVA
jgi:small subunit ribosomal protein S3